MKSLFYLSNSDFSTSEANAAHVEAMVNAATELGIHTVCAGWNTRYLLRGDPKVERLEYPSELNPRLRYKSYFPRAMMLALLLSRLMLHRVLNKTYAISVVRKISLLRYLVGMNYSEHYFIEVHSPLAPTQLSYISKVIARNPRMLTLIPVSNAMSDWLIANGFEKDSILMLRDAGCSGLPKVKYLDVKALDLVYVGSIGHGRGIESLLEAFKELKNCRLRLYGRVVTGYIKPQSSWDGERYYAGELERPEVHKVYRDNTIAMCTYDTEVFVDKRLLVDTSQYMSPMKIFEAMSRGVVVVCPDLPVLEEFLSHGQNCLMYRAGDGKGLAALLRSVAENRWDLGAIGSRAYDEIQAEHNWKRRVALMLQAPEK